MMPTPDKLDLKRSQSIYRYALNIWITALLASFVWSRGEVPILREIQGDAAVARYSVALTLYGGAVAGIMLGMGGVAQQITRLWGDGQLAAAVSLSRKAMNLQLLLAGLSAVFLISFSPEIMHWGFGAKYAESAPLLAILALGLPALTVASHNHLLQIITGARFTRNATVAGVMLLAGLSWFGVQIFGVSGAAWSRSITLIVIAAITLLVCWRRWGISSLSPWNLVWIALLTGASVFVNQQSFFEELMDRTLIFFLSAIALTMLLRHEQKTVLRILYFRLREWRN